MHACTHARAETRAQVHTKTRAHTHTHARAHTHAHAQLKFTTKLKGKYLPPMASVITARLGGTQTERILVLNVNRLERSDEMTMVGGVGCWAGPGAAGGDCSGSLHSARWRAFHTRTMPLPFCTQPSPIHTCGHTHARTHTHTHTPTHTYTPTHTHPPPTHTLHIAHTQVCDTHGIVTFATWEIAALLGFSTKKLIGTKLDALLPPPYNSMHAKWLQETPATVPKSSCRAGVVVQFINTSHVLVPVRIRVNQMEDQARTLHVIRVGGCAHVPDGRGRG